MGQRCSRTSTASDSDDDCDSEQRPDIVLVGAGAERAAKLVARMRRKLPYPLTLINGGGKDSQVAASAIQAAQLGILVLCKDTVRSQACMAHLEQLLQRWLSGELELLAVLCGLQVEELQHMRHLYDTQPWSGPDDERPSAAVLDTWAEELQLVAQCSAVTASQFPGQSQLAAEVVARAVDLLEAAKQLQSSSTLVVHNKVGRPRVPRRGPAPELPWHDASVVEALYVELRGGPGEGKTLLAQHLVQRACELWQRRTVHWGHSGGGTANALLVDLQGLTQERGFQAAVAESLLTQLEVSAYKDHWDVLQQWLVRERPAPQLVLFEGAEDSVHLKAFNYVIKSLLDARVHVMVATRKPSSVPEHVLGQLGTARADVRPPVACHIVDLQQEASAGGLALLEAMVGRSLGRRKERAAAKMLVEAVRGNALLLAVAAGLAKGRSAAWPALWKSAQQELPTTGVLSTHPATCTRQQIAVVHRWLSAHLDAPQQQLLRSLSPFVGGFTAAAAAVVNVANDATDDGAVRGTLLEFARMSLVSCRLVSGISDTDAASSRVTRYDVHPVVRQAAHRLHESESAAMDAVAAFTAWTLEHPDGPGRALSRSDPEGPTPDLAMVEYLLKEELRNLTAAAAHLGAVLHATALDGALPDMVSHLGRLLRETGQWQVGRVLQEELLAVREVVLGPKHLDTLVSKEDLSWTLCQIGQVEDMRRLQEEILEVRTGRLGAENRETLNSLASYGLCLHLRGQLDDARRVLEQATAATTSVLGPDHLSTLFAKSCLAITLEQLGLLPGAKQLHEDVLAAKVRVLGREHPDTLNSKCDVAWTLNLHGHLREARQLQEEVLAVRKRVLGPRHPNVLIASRANLAAFLFLLGELREARVMQEEVLAVATRLLGPAHPHTIISTNNLAETLFELGEWEEARRLQEAMLQVCEATLAREHSETLTSKCNLAITLRELGHLERSRQLNEEVLEVATRLQASDSLRILNARSDLGVTLWRMGELAGARRLQEQVLVSRLRLMGPEHPDTLGTQNDLALVMSDMGEVRTACELLKHVRKARTALLGEGHPRTLGTVHDLGVVLGRLGEVAAARRVLGEAAAGREAVLGARHPHTLASRAQLAVLAEQAVP